MDTEPEEMRQLGFAGICHEACKIAAVCRRIFSKIALALVLPLALVFLAHIAISDLLFRKINRNEDALEKAPDGSAAEDRILARLSSEWTAFLLFKGAYLLVALVFSLLSTSAVVYTVACVYTAKDITFSKVMYVVPKVWRRLMVTFLWSFGMMLCYNTAAILVIVLVLLALGEGAAGLAVLFLVLLVYLAGLVYISIIWHLASVISVLEDSYGISAMEKSRDLLRGKAWVAAGIFLLLQLLFVVIEVAFKSTVVRGGGVLWRLGSGALILSLMCLLILLALVVQSVVYFVCKAYHHQSIDKSSLADHLEVYLGEYVPLNSRDVQLQQFQV